MLKKSTGFFIKAAFFIVIVHLSSCNLVGRETNRDAILARLVLERLDDMHFLRLSIDDKFSRDVFKLYLTRLDFEKKFFLQSDIDELKPFETEVDNELLAGRVDFYNKVQAIYTKRLSEGKGYYEEILSKPLSFSVKESIETDPEKITYAASPAELQDRWRKIIKHRVLIRLMSATEEQESQTNVPKTNRSFAELEAESRKLIQKNLKKSLERSAEQKPEERLSDFINAVAGIYDPHTEFMPPDEKEGFDIRMSGTLEGIGALLSEEDRFIKVVSIVPGSPSYWKKELQAGDIILKVAQGGGEPVDIVEAKVSDAVKLIRGKKGTEVRLTVKKPDGRITVYSIIRDVVVLEETFAKSAIFKSERDGKNYGYIFLPVFYRDFNGTSARNSSDDVRAELEKLKKLGVDGILLDLRNNGGGSLEDAVRLAGLFFPTGPVVQVRDRANRGELLQDSDPSVVYGGPVVVMVNALSASASEIVAAALQDYQRAVIVGGGHTFGKGTVQRLVPLNSYMSFSDSSKKGIGSLKVTVQKFYRVTGASTQYLGVVPDVILPDPTLALEVGEKSLEHSLKWDTTEPARFQAWSQSTYSAKELQNRSKERVAASKPFSLLKENVSFLEAQKKRTSQSLEWDSARAEQAKSKEESKRFKEIRLTTPLKGEPVERYENLPEELRKQKQVVQGEWMDQLRKDIFIGEALQVLGDVRK